VSHLTDSAGCGGNGAGTGGACGAPLPVSPFFAPRYHFGMLLGVDDFEAEQGYHRGKGRLHNAWLHGPGVVWGMGVDLPDVEGRPGVKRGEVRVTPGFALDAAGRELHLDAAACLSFAAWYAVHRDEPEVVEAATVGEDGTVTLDAHVVARFRACLARPVPSISEPCAGGGGDVAYSRTTETVELLLRPGRAPASPRDYHRLRVLFSLEAPDASVDGIADVVKARDDILALAPEKQPAAYLEAFRRFAARDEIDLGPAADPDGGGGSTLFPAGDDCVVVLADVLGLTLVPATGTEEETWRFGGAAVDVTVRPSHVATSTIQELLCGPRFTSPAAAPPPDPDEEDADPPPLPGDAGGPRIDPASVVLEGEAVTMTATARLSKASVAEKAFSVSAYDLRDGWHEVEVVEARTTDRGGRAVRLELATGFGGNLVRVIARGTGPSPLLGAAGLVPLAGAVGGPAGSANDGHDFVLMVKRSAT
jgi:hypothetical protein